jgi:endonuclease/exonuclease/phosphatase family metal-dependent hydrolase
MARMVSTRIAPQYALTHRILKVFHTCLTECHQNTISSPGGLVGKFLFVIATFFLQTTAHAGEPQYTHQFDLKVLSYNVHWDAFDASEKERYTQIARILKQRLKDGTAPHIVLIQEAFAPNNPDILVEKSGYPFYRRGPNGPWGNGKYVGSGLIILSLFPLKANHEIIYSKCKGIDCNADKGAMSTRIQIPGLFVPLDLYNTHLDATCGMDDWYEQDRKEQIEVRISQLGELMKLRESNIKKQGEGLVLFAGDFNVLPINKDYQFWVSQNPELRDVRTQFATADRIGESNLAPEDDWRFDYMFMHNPAEPVVSMVPIRYERNFIDRVNGLELSDHPGLEVTYRIKW